METLIIKAKLKAMGRLEVRFVLKIMEEKVA